MNLFNNIKKDFTKKYDENNVNGYLFKVDAKYPKQLLWFHNELTFIPEEMVLSKIEKLISSANDKKYMYIYFTTNNFAKNIELWTKIKDQKHFWNLNRSKYGINNKSKNQV